MKTSDETLHVPDTVALKEEMKIGVAAAPNVEKQAEEFVANLLAVDPAQMNSREAGKQSVENMGTDLQKKAAHQSQLLQQPLKTLSQRGEDGGDVAQALVKLKVEVEALDPNKFDFSPGWFSRLLGFLPGIGTPLKKYFSKYESAQTVIAAVMQSLDKGRDQLERDNITLKEDQKQMREMAEKLSASAKLGQLIDQKVQYKLEREIQPADPKHKFVSEEILFPLRQRIIDLQTQLAVQQQGILASEIIIRNNQELIRGVGRAQNVTVSALQVAVTVAMALENQKIVLNKIEAVTKTTSDLIAGTAARLKTQGAQIHKQASSAQIDLNSLKSAFGDIEAAFEDISKFRIQALPQMASTVLELDQISSKASQSIQRLQEGNKAKTDFKLDVKS